MSGIAPAELDFTDGERRRSRGRGASSRTAARPTRGDGGRGRSRPAPAPRAELRRENARPPVAVFAQPAAKPAPRDPAPEHRVVGFGDDLPAFLARAPRVAAGA
jgi:hypothetical protein